MSNLVFFLPSGLTKFGNGDGDRPEWLFDEAPDFHGSWRRVLFSLCEEYVAPLLPEGYELFEMQTAHNPCRVKYHGEYDDDPTFEPFTVVVPHDAVMEAVRHE